MAPHKTICCARFSAVKMVRKSGLGFLGTELIGIAKKLNMTLHVKCMCQNVKNHSTLGQVLGTTGKGNRSKSQLLPTSDPAPCLMHLGKLWTKKRPRHKMHVLEL